MAVATAISQALKKVYQDNVEIDLINEKFTPFPFKHMNAIYHWQLKFKNAGYGTSWRATNNVRLFREAMDQIYPIVKNTAQKIVRKKVDVIVTTHPGFVYPVLRARRELGKNIKFITMVSDLMVTHASWCADQSDLVLVPTEEVFNRAARHGIEEKSMRIVGLPVRQDFTEGGFNKSEVLKFLNLKPNLKTVLLMGGGEGVGKIEDIAESLNDPKLKIQMVIVAGRNYTLLNKLDKKDWKVPTKIFGFIDFLPQVMNASDILITKGGPTTICEGFTKGLPMIIYDYIPVQEEKNVELVVDKGAGVLEKNPRKIKNIVRKWVDEEKELRKVADNSRRFSQKDSAVKVAKIIYETAVR